MILSKVHLAPSSSVWTITIIVTFEPNLEFQSYFWLKKKAHGAEQTYDKGMCIFSILLTLSTLKT